MQEPTNISAVGSFRQRLAAGPVWGPFSKTCDAGMIEVLALGGFDFVILDMEHGPNGFETVQHLIRAAERRGMLPIVRVAQAAEQPIAKALDLGAGGLQVPQISDPGQLRRVLHAARFAPRGERGVCRYVRAAGYSAMPRQQYFVAANEALIVIQVEGQQGLANLDALLEVGGFDIVFIGPYDLSQSLGLVGQVEHPRVLAAMEEVVRRCQARGVVTGTFVESPAASARWRAAGVRYLSYAVDVGILLEAARAIVAQVRAPEGAPR